MESCKVNPQNGGLQFLDQIEERLPECPLSIEERYQLCLSVAEECVQPEELLELIKKKPHPVCYDGFEPSGRMHIAQGLLKSAIVNKLTKAGCQFIFWVADWFALMNNKMGGDLNKIQIVGRYLIEIWKAAGMDMRSVKFMWTSQEILKHPNEYWSLVLDIARKNNLSRITRCSQIMGRSESEELQAAQIMYPCMQCADIFYLKADICQLGMDQRKVNMLAREYCDDIKRKEKPVILSHHMLMGLKEGQAKMSKSDPDSAIFMEDTEEDVKRKVKKAYCPPQVIQDNPILDYTKNLIFMCQDSFLIERTPENGGPKLYAKFEELEADFLKGDLHPGDLKSSVTKTLNAMLEPVRRHFREDQDAKELLEKVRSFATTR